MGTDVNTRRIWLNGMIVPVNEAKINILAPTSQFGLNVFEGIRCYWNQRKKELYAFRLDDHYERLVRSAHLLDLFCDFSVIDMKEALISVVRANDYREDIAVRQTLFVDGFGSWRSNGPTGMFVAPIPKTKSGQEYNKDGLNCCVSSWRRITDNTLSPRIKCGANYINSRMAQIEAQRNNYDTAIFLNEFGKIAESPGACLFIVKEGVLVTPSITDSVLESITRDTVIKLAGNMGMRVEERSIDRTELYVADEVFLCGSAMEITPVVSVDRYRMRKNGEGEVTRQIHMEYMNTVLGENVEHLSWVTPVYS